jgi:hypothetical protein
MGLRLGLELELRLWWGLRIRIDWNVGRWEALKNVRVVVDALKTKEVSIVERNKQILYVVGSWSKGLGRAVEEVWMRLAGVIVIGGSTLTESMMPMNPSTLGRFLPSPRLLRLWCSVRLG